VQDARVVLERTEIVLPARGRFDLRATVLARGLDDLPPYRWHDGRTPLLERAEELQDGSVHLLAIRPDRRGVVLQVTGPDAREIEVLAPLAARVRRALALDFDPAAFQRACAGDPLLRPVARLGLGRVLHGTSCFEDVVTTLVHDSARIRARLAALGPRCPAQPALRAFPSARLLARIGVQRLRERTGLGPRAAWVHSVARDAPRGDGLEAIDSLSVTGAARRLAAVRGLPPAGIARVLVLLGHHDRAALDPAIRASVRRALGDRHLRVEHWLRRHRPRRGLALWCALWLESPEARLLAAPGGVRTSRKRALLGRRAAGS
jgi:3-methyladenine DNA glycosylase/8-oxoguanine DNA glycosylase